MADVKARVDAHDEQTKRLHHMLEERTTEHGAANKPLKVRVPATWSARGPLSCTASQSDCTLWRSFVHACCGCMPCQSCKKPKEAVLSSVSC